MRESLCSRCALWPGLIEPPRAPRTQTEGGGPAEDAETRGRGGRGYREQEAEGGEQGAGAADGGPVRIKGAE